MKNHSIICLVSNDLNQDQRMHRICESLYASGYDVLLVGRQKKQSLPLPDLNFRAIRLKCLFQQGVFFYAELFIRQFYLLWSIRPQIVYCVDPDTLLAGYLYKKLKTSKLVYDAHEFFEESPEIRLRPLVRNFWKKILSLSIKEVDLCITVGKELAKILDQKYQHTFHVVRNCPAYRAVKPYQTSEPRILIYQGMLNQGRGLEEVIYALHQLPDYRLELAGNGDLEEKLKDLVKRERLEDRVKFLGFLEGEELIKFTERPAIGLNLLDGKSKSYFFSLANKTFDYMMAGIPSLQMDFPEYRQIHEDYQTFILVPELTVEAILDSLLSFNDFNILNQNNLEAAKYYNWDKEKQNLIKIFKDLIV